MVADVKPGWEQVLLALVENVQTVARGPGEDAGKERVVAAAPRTR
jgi:hypothetical protein